jgi:hypothetical protein
MVAELLVMPVALTALITGTVAAVAKVKFVEVVVPAPFVETAA